MFKKISRHLERKREGKVPVKFRFDVRCLDLRGVPSKSVKQCRVVWSRGPKVQMTKLSMVASGVAKFDEMLSQVATVYKASENTLEPKEYNFKIQSPGKGSDSKMLTIGRATVDMARYATLLASKPEVLEIPINFEFSKSRPAGVLRLSITGVMLKGLAPEDTLTEMSMMSGVSTLSRERVAEQDLAGFEPSELSFDARGQTFPLERGQSFQHDNDTSFTTGGQHRNQQFGTLVTSSMGLPAQTSESITINSRQSPDSDFNFGFEKMIAENAELKEALAKAQAEKEELRAACQAAVEQEDNLHAQLDNLRQSQGVNKDYSEEDEEEEEEEEDCEVLGLRSRLAALEAEKATWTAKLEEAAKFKLLAEEAVKEKETLEAELARGATVDSGSDLEFHVQSENEESQGESTRRRHHHAMGDKEELRQKLEASEKLVLSLEQQHADVYNQLEQLVNEREQLKKQLEDLSAEVSEMSNLRAKVATLEEELSELMESKAVGEAVVELRKERDEISKELSVRIQEATKAEEWAQDFRRTLRNSEDQLAAAMSRIEELEEEKASNEVEMSALKGEKEQMLEATAVAEHTARDMQARQTELESIVSALEADVHEYQSRMEQLQGSNVEAEAQVKELHVKNEKMASEYDTLLRRSEALSKVEKQLSVQELACGELQQSLAETEDRCANTEEKLSEVTAALAAANDRATALAAECAEAETMVSETLSKAQQSEDELKAALETVSRLEAEITEVLAQKSGACERVDHLEKVCADLELNAENTADALEKLTTVEEVLAATVAEKQDLEAKVAESEAVSKECRDRATVLEESLLESQEKAQSCQSDLKGRLATAEQERDLLQHQLQEAENRHSDFEVRFVKMSESLAVSEANLGEATAKLESCEERLAGAEAKLSTSENRVQEALEEKSVVEQRLLEVGRCVQELEATSASNATRVEQLEESLAAVTSQKREAEQMSYELEQTRDTLTGKISSLEESLKEDHATAMAVLEREWSSRVSELENENADLHRREVNLSDSLGTAKNELERLSDSLGQRVEFLEAEARESEAKMDGLELEKEEFRGRVLEAEKQVSQVKLERDAALENHAEAVAELQRSKEQVLALGSERDGQLTMIDSANARAAQLESDMVSLSTQCTSLSDQLKVATVGQEECAKELAAVRTTVSELEGERSKLQQDNLRLIEEAAAAQAQIKDLEESASKVEAECETLRGRCTQLAEEVAGTSSRLHELQGNSEGMKSDFDRLQAEAEALKSEHAAIQENNLQLQADVCAANAQISDLKALESVNDDLSKLQSDHRNLQDEVKVLRETNVELSKSSSTATAMMQDNENLRTELASLETSSSQFLTEIQDLKAENASMKTEVEGLRSAAATAALKAS
ncbi:unnamed protein product [Ostreobium quekettii]|uniref:C2 NT-type domain-containing protein n=1 Tax=Ostreobium quekettii TaxID=121088 RepID=A0A8S1IKT9_9CHLO|nr:unnamed protein product [Ostreobium quekettii]